MIRMFQTHETRYQRELDGMWKFQPLDSDGIPQKFNFQIPVPSCWEEHPLFSTYRGKAAYRKNIFLKSKENVLLEFKGVSHTADVFVDGKKAVHHYNAYTPFSAICSGLELGSHEITVIADNSFSEKSALHIPNDYYTYGGIIRPVSLEYVNDVFIENIEFNPEPSDDHWNACIKVNITNLSENSITVGLKSSISGNELDFGNVTIPEKAEISVSKAFAFDDVLSWGEESPKLYLLKTVLADINSGEPVDDLIERVGFRNVKVSGQKILVNGKEVFLKGFCRHEDFGLTGCAVPVQLMAKDIELILDSGANSIRTTHYPNDERFLDMCDERGIYVFEENHARGIGLDGMKNGFFEPQCEACNEEMVRSHYNHPSVIIWGLLNECASDTPEGKAMYEKQIKQIKALDKSRPVTFATCKHFRDLCLELADIISLNIYSRWYKDTDPKEDLKKLLEWANESGGADKPVIISEFGGEGIYGNHSPDRLYWSEESQSDIIEEALDAYFGNESVSGTYIWQFCDNRVTDGYFRTGRPGMVNNKGVVDLYRRPKAVYSTVKSRYKGKA